MLRWEEADKALRRRGPARRRKAPGPARPAAPSPAEAAAAPLVDALCDPDEQRRQAAARHVLRTCIPAVVALVCRLLVERVAATWLQTAYFDGLLAQAAGAGEARLKVLRQMQDAAHRRHLASLKQLAVVRRLLRPAPSPLELLRAPVGETSPAPAATRRAGLPRCGAAAGVEN